MFEPNRETCIVLELFVREHRVTLRKVDRKFLSICHDCLLDDLTLFPFDYYRDPCYLSKHGVDWRYNTKKNKSPSNEKDLNWSKLIYFTGIPYFVHRDVRLVPLNIILVFRTCWDSLLLVYIFHEGLDKYSVFFPICTLCEVVTNT